MACRARRCWWISQRLLGVGTLQTKQAEALEAFAEGAVRQAVNETVAKTIANCQPCGQE